MALRFPKDPDNVVYWVRELVDECMRSSEDRGLLYTRASQYYYMGSHDTRAAIMNKTKPFVDRLSGMIYQPTDVRFNMLYDNGSPIDVLERADLVAEKLTADFRQTDSDVRFHDAVTWSLINGCSILKLRPMHHSMTFAMDPVHPQNFGIMSETTQQLEHQEAVCHVSYFPVSKIEEMLEESGVPENEIANIIDKLMQKPKHDTREEESGYVHQMVVGGLQPVGSLDQSPAAAGVVNVFPLNSPWKPTMPIAETVKFCEVWIRDGDRDLDWTTIQFIYPDVMIWPRNEKQHANLSSVPGRLPFVKVQAMETPGYFWGRSVVADIQLLQDVLNKRLRDLKIMWDRNANAPMSLSGFSSVTQDMYFKIVSEGGFISDPNPNANAKALTEPPPPLYLEDLQYISQLFDEAGGFTPVTTGQGEAGVRSGVHAQTLVRTSTPRLIAPAASIERNLAEVGELAVRLMQAQDPRVYVTTDQNIHFYLEQMPDNFQIEVDSHSASPIFREDNAQVAAFLVKTGAIDSEDAIRLMHPPQTDRLLARLNIRQKAMARKEQQDKQEDLLRDITGAPARKQQGRGGGRSRGATLHSIGILLLIGGTLAAAAFGDRLVKAVYALPNGQVAVSFVRP